MSFSASAIKYFLNLKTPARLPVGIEVINPYMLPEVKEAVKKFFNKFYSDNNKRIYIIGINPGRFGGGLTGIAFTDPAALRNHCGVENDLGSKQELSSKFIYEIITAFGGAEKFFSTVFMTAFFPLALTCKGKNYNYYDDKMLFGILKPEIIKSVLLQIKFGAKKEKVIILGKKNAEYFKIINDEFKFFNKIIILDHPRFIMQYRQRFKNYYITDYLSAIK